MTEHVVNLYMHEVAMHVDHSAEEFKLPPFTEDALRGVGEEPVTLTPAHISALSICLKSIDGIFETFLKIDPETIRCLPVGNFVRVAYAVVVLLKMYFAAATPNSELGKVIDKDNMKVEQYLDSLVETFRASAAEEKSRPSAKFLMVLIMLKTWFHRQLESKPTTNPSDISTTFPSGKNGAETPAEPPSDNNQNGQRQNNQQRQPGYSPANTPLQLLSEVATGNQGGQSRGENSNNYPQPSNDWHQQPQFQNYDPSMNITQGYGHMPMAGNFDLSLGIGMGMDLGYAMGDGFEQAMGMALGAGTFGNYSSDNAFFGSVMDSGAGGAGAGGGTGFDGF